MNIKRKIAARGYTLSQVASMMVGKNGEEGITQSSLSQIINGNPTIGKLQEIANIIGVPVGELVSDSDGLTALVRSGGEYYQANSLEELEAIVNEIRGK